MYFDYEAKILEMVRLCISEKNRVLLFNNNSFNKKVRSCLINESALITNNGHDMLPPDYYSEEYGMMFDVMCINDSEQRKHYNPVKMRERKAEKEILTMLGDCVTSDRMIICASETNDISEHTYKSYCKNCQRVVNKHVKKIPIWTKEHPNIRQKGLLICDETEAYFEGVSFPSGHSDPGKSWVRGMVEGTVFHYPWLDRKFVQRIYESPVDFVVWFAPYKPFGYPRIRNMFYPELVIIDTRYSPKGLIDYSEHLVC